VNDDVVGVFVVVGSEVEVAADDGPPEGDGAGIEDATFRSSAATAQM
jgi:hypothetical protein